MRKYKLLKDLPTFRAGSVFELSENGLYCVEKGSKPVMAYAKKTLNQFPNILNEWFEEVKEPEGWKPQQDELYGYLTDSGKVVPIRWVSGCKEDERRYAIGNCFRTKKEAKRAVEKLKAFRILREHGLTFQDWRWDNDGDRIGMDDRILITATITSENSSLVAEDWEIDALDLLFRYGENEREEGK